MERRSTDRRDDEGRQRPQRPAPRPRAVAALDLEGAVFHLRSQGLRLSRLKRAVLEEFTRGSCGFSAEELAERIGLNGDVSPLYRCLSSLEAAGVLTHFYLDDGSRRYDPADRFGAHHHHLVCVQCAGIERMDGCGLTSDVARQAEASGFTLRDHSVMLRGLCPACRDIDPDPETPAGPGRSGLEPSP